MYAIRSYYGRRNVFRMGALLDDLFPGYPPRHRAGQRGLHAGPRITSYNVCYTKLLRETSDDMAWIEIVIPCTGHRQAGKGNAYLSSLQGTAL